MEAAAARRGEGRGFIEAYVSSPAPQSGCRHPSLVDSRTIPREMMPFPQTLSWALWVGCDGKKKLKGVGKVIPTNPHGEESGIGDDQEILGTGLVLLLLYPPKLFSQPMPRKEKGE